MTGRTRAAVVGGALADEDVLRPERRSGRSVPSPGRVALAYLRSPGAWSNPASMIGWLVALPLAAAWYEARHVVSGAIPLALVLTIVGILFPTRLWSTAGSADSRPFFFAAPVGRTRNVLARVGTGWLWCMFYCGAILLLMPVWRDLAGGGAANLPMTDIPEATARWRSIIPLGAATLGYLYSTIGQVGSRRPGVWLAVIVFVGTLGPTAGVFADYGGNSMMSLLLGRASHIGLARAISGPPPRLPDTGWPVFDAGLDAWLLALGFWLAIGLIGLVIAARRHQEW